MTDAPPPPPLPWTLTRAESKEWCNADFMYRHHLRRYSVPPPDNLIQLKAEYDAAFAAAQAYNMFSNDRHMRSTTKKAQRLLGKYLALEAVYIPASDKWRLAHDTDDARHRRAVEQALADGLPVPPQVLAEYPDLTTGGMT